MPLTVEAVINSRRRFSDGVCRFYAFAIAVFAQNIHLPRDFDGFQSISLYQETKPVRQDLHKETDITSHCRHLDSSADNQRVPQSSVAG